MALVAQIESAVSRLFYRPEYYSSPQLCYRVGLQSPVWVWTHRVTGESDRDALDLKKTFNLLCWFCDNGVDMRRVAVVAPGSLLPELQRLTENGHKGTDGVRRGIQSVIMQHQDVTAQPPRGIPEGGYDVILFVMGSAPTESNARHMVQYGERSLGAAIGLARSAFVLIADACWESPHIFAAWPQWKVAVSRLRDERPRISHEPLPGAECIAGAAGQQRFPTLFGEKIPLCCAAHPGQRQLETGMSSIARTCKRLCLAHFSCNVEEHVCVELCHPAVSHKTCSFACAKLLPCGHVCQKSCTDRCDCLHEVEVPLPCSHAVVVGINQETLEPVYGGVQHVFKGVCVDSEYPCQVQVTSGCARCLGELVVPCHEAQRHGHSLENKTLVCGKCLRTERDIRSRVLSEVLVTAEEAKRKLKTELKRALYQQSKAAAQGMFAEGSRVCITDVTKIVRPLCMDMDFPGVPFVDYDAEGFYAQMNGCYGIFVSRHVDVDNLTEVRNLIRLPSGKHVLVADGGAQLIHAITSSAASLATAAPAFLMLTDNASPSAVAPVAGSGGGANGTISPADHTGKDLVDTLMYLSQPVTVADAKREQPCESTMDNSCEDAHGGASDEAVQEISDTILRIVAVDGANKDNVIAEYEKVILCPKESSAEGSAAAPRGEGDASSAAHLSVHPAPTTHLVAVRTTLEISVPIAHLEPLHSLKVGTDVIIQDPSRAVTNPHDLDAFQAAMEVSTVFRGGRGEAGAASCTLASLRVESGVPYTLVGLLNEPDYGLSRHFGPCAVLLAKPQLVRSRAAPDVAAACASMRRARGNVVQPLCGEGRSAAATSHCLSPPTRKRARSPSPEAAPRAMAVLVPFVFLTVDELREAEQQLDTAAQQHLEREVRSRIDKASEEAALRNDEEAFNEQRQMPPVTQEALQRRRVAYSIPVPLLSKEAVAATLQRRSRMQCVGAEALRLAHQKDAVAGKLEKLQEQKWASNAEQEFQRDREATAAYVKLLATHAARRR